MTQIVAAISIDAVDRALATRAWRLGFSADLEAYFRRETIARHAPTLLMCTFISCIFYPLFLISDYRQIADVFSLMVAFRIFGFVPLSMILVYLLWKRPQNPYIEILGVTIAFLSVFWVILALNFSHSVDRANYIPGFVIGMIYGTVVHRPRFKYSLGLVASILIAAVIFLRLSHVVDNSAIMRHVLFFTTSGVLMLMASYTFERATRQAFLHGLRSRLLNEQLEKVAMTDPLTGLGNRRFFEAAVERIRLDSNLCQSVAAVMVDLDYFKLYNDAYGHFAGDECLVRVAHAIKGAVRPEIDVVSRFGGEEFVVLLPQVDEARARFLAETIRRAIVAIAIPHRGVGSDAVVTASLGVAAAPVGVVTIYELLTAADRALYEAKNSGRDCVRLASPLVAKHKNTAPSMPQQLAS